ncbi:adenylate cyclase, terminal-differentiation specific-like isoform X2 [Cuculus canorus]|uniref:adenylate cyclase, terminal-differentiation specific-like isoform X2 n=1 Tax=Cuculus canorus TaxID=55661 RepID=UPI0023AA4EC1|nr:adenylate cyclase, terminal-differentiation specific-like isoform X2 [Cuculus canorus]
MQQEGCGEEHPSQRRGRCCWGQRLWDSVLHQLLCWATVPGCWGCPRQGWVTSMAAPPWDRRLSEDSGKHLSHVMISPTVREWSRYGISREVSAPPSQPDGSRGGLPGVEEATPELRSSIQQFQQETETGQPQGEMEVSAPEPQQEEPQACQERQQQQLEPAEVQALMKDLQLHLNICRGIKCEQCVQPQNNKHQDMHATADAKEELQRSQEQLQALRKQVHSLQESLQKATSQAQHWQQLYHDSKRDLALREEELLMCKVEMAFLQEELSKATRQPNEHEEHKMSIARTQDEHHEDTRSITVVSRFYRATS